MTIWFGKAVSTGSQIVIAQSWTIEGQDSMGRYRLGEIILSKAKSGH
jgi:hypothetical protein